MQVNGGIDLPTKLIDALASGRLVVFAGAGVSIGDPSNLPSFETLACMVAGQTAGRLAGEPVESFLGRLADEGLHVHEEVARIIRNSESSPTGLHRALVALFNSPATLRIVTTNFDLHFRTVGVDRFGADLEVFMAPALPLARSFSGLVYLHGCADHRPNHLVVTDRDFGRAYLTEGWATRFLCDLFQFYTVLFIGYSHNDTVMRYLARALPPNTSRYAMAKAGEEANWQHLGIHLVPYELAAQSIEPHVHLTRAIQDWAKLSNMGLLEHEDRIKRLVANRSALTPEEASYLENALRRQETARFFTRHARGLEWLAWADSQPVFQSLFDPKTQSEDLLDTLATWFADHYVLDYPLEALAAVHRRGNTLSCSAWQAITLAFCRAEDWPEPEALAAWVTTLITTALGRPSDGELLAQILIEMRRRPEHALSGSVLLAHLATPKLQPSSIGTAASASDSERLSWSFEVSFDAGARWLGDAWRNVFRPQLASVADTTATIAADALTHAHLLLRAVGKADDWRDQMSLARTAIEPHEQDRWPEPIDALIDAVRDSIEYLLEHEPDQADARVQTWSCSDVPLLRRAAIHAVALSKNRSPDAKIEWLLDRDWLFALRAKHEVFHLLEKTYAEASEKVRIRLLGVAKVGPTGVYRQRLKQRTRDYETYNLLVWLNRIAPLCHHARVALDAAQQRHPDFAPREYPDLGTYVTVGWEEPGSSQLAADLVHHDPAQVASDLTEQKEAVCGFPRDVVVLAMPHCAQLDADWALRLAAELTRFGYWSVDLWHGLVRGFGQTALSEEQWDTLLALCARNPEASALVSGIADLLTSSSVSAMPAAALATAQELACRLLEEGRRTESMSPEPEDWFMHALGDPAAKLTRFLLVALSQELRAESGTKPGMPARLAAQFEAAVTGSSDAASSARVILAHEMPFLYNTEPAWACRHILPLFDWSCDPERAKQAWHGFLSQPRLSDTLVQLMLPYYRQTFTHLDELPRRPRQGLAAHLAAIAMYGFTNPMDEGWLPAFVRASHPRDREDWAAAIGRALEAVNPALIPDIWGRWLHRYWSDRQVGRPRRLDNSESRQMVLWTLHLGPVFPEAVELSLAAPPPDLSHAWFYRHLGETDLAQSHPLPVASLLRHLLSGEACPLFASRQVV